METPIKIYLLSHQSSYRGFEDYCLGLQSLLIGLGHEVVIIIFQDESDIPYNVNEKTCYLFLSYIPPRFIRLHLIHEHPRICLMNTEQSTRQIWKLILQDYQRFGITIFDYDTYQGKLLTGVPPREAPQWSEGGLGGAMLPLGSEGGLGGAMLPLGSEGGLGGAMLPLGSEGGLGGATLPLPYQITEEEHQHLMSLVSKSPKYYNVAFCSINHSKRRNNIAQQLQKRGIKVLDVAGWGEDRDQRIAKSQMLVNIHYESDYQIFEHFRCDRWILSGMLVVSEPSLSDPELDCRDLMIIEPYQTLVDKICDIVNNYDTYYHNYLEKLLLCKKTIINARIEHLVALTQS